MASAYFSKLNYTLANEDTALELSILPMAAEHVLSVCGSGGRALPLLAKAPKRLTLVDVSQEQLYLAELRLAAMKALDWQDFLAFMGYPPQPMNAVTRRRIFSILELSSPARDFLSRVFTANGFASILYDGQWERTFAKIATVTRLATGQDGLGLFDCRSLDEQRDYLRAKFPRRRWLAALRLIGQASVFNALLYRGSFPVMNLPMNHFEFYRQAFARSFALRPARENFFLQIVFFGRLVFAEGLPIECDQKVFLAAKSALEKTEIRFIRGDFLAVAESLNDKVDFVSFSDVPSYFTGPAERQFMQRLRPALTDGALVVNRSYLHVPFRPDYSGFDHVTAAYADAIAGEVTQMYVVDVLVKRQ